MSNNPFSITFGEQPLLYVDRENELSTVINSFNSDIPDSKIYIITGPRGCGKTVAMTNLKSFYSEKNNWICVDINPYAEMHEQLASKIIDQGEYHSLFLRGELSFSFCGVNLVLKGENPVSSVFTLLDFLFKFLMERNIKVLVMIDDVSNSLEIRKFVYSFQYFLREKYPCYLLMTGLCENVSDLSNEDNLTFLLRAPKIELSSLNFRQIAYYYEDYLSISFEDATKLAKFTGGYAYGFQLLGNLMYKNNEKEITERTLREYDVILDDNVYGKIWESMTKKEKVICIAIAKTKDGKTAEILELSGVTNNVYQNYKKKLSKSGIIDDKNFGFVSFSLPRFKEFVVFRSILEDD